MLAAGDTFTPSDRFFPKHFSPEDEKKIQAFRYPFEKKYPTSIQINTFTETSNCW